MIATTPVKYKKNTKVSKQGLTRYYGPLWSDVLGDKVCEPVNMPGLWASEDLPDQGSRAKRLGEVGEIIKDCLDVLAEIPNADDLINDLESIQVEIQGVEFPGMY